MRVLPTLIDVADGISRNFTNEGRPDFSVLKQIIFGFIVYRWLYFIVIKLGNIWTSLMIKLPIP